MQDFSIVGFGYLVYFVILRHVWNALFVEQLSLLDLNSLVSRVPFLILFLSETNIKIKKMALVFETG